MVDRPEPGFDGDDKRTGWELATVESVYTESPRVKLFRLKLESPRRFLAGQYFDVRLTAPDGYQAQRSYSVASSPDDPDLLELAIELISDGEVSSYFHEAVEPGEQIELRGPIGGHFTWAPEFTGSLLLVAGGSGIAPLMSMLRQRRVSESAAPATLMFSVRSEEDILYRKTLEALAEYDRTFNLVITLTREAPADWPGQTRRIDSAMIGSAIESLGSLPGRAYVCGGTGFVESIASNLLDAGMGYDSIRTERFGP